MNKTLIVSVVLAFLAGFMISQFGDQNILPMHKMALYENLSKKLKKKYTPTREELSQGKHVASVYAYGTYSDVLEWYYETKWKYDEDK